MALNWILTLVTQTYRCTSTEIFCSCDTRHKKTTLEYFRTSQFCIIPLDSYFLMLVCSYCVLFFHLKEYIFQTLVVFDICKKGCTSFVIGMVSSPPQCFRAGNNSAFKRWKLNFITFTIFHHWNLAGWLVTHISQVWKPHIYNFFYTDYSWTWYLCMYFVGILRQYSKTQVCIDYFFFWDSYSDI